MSEAWDGRIPPKDIEIEEVILGAMMIEKEAPDRVLNILKPDHFYIDAHINIFSAIRDLYEKGEPVDVMTVVAKLKQKGLLEASGGAHYIAELTGKVSSSANIEYHSRILIEKYVGRQLIRISGETAKAAFDETTDYFNLLDHTEQALFAIKNDSIRKNYEDIGSLLAKQIKHIESIDASGGMSGIPSGFSSIDKITSGWQNSDLIIIAGRPGMGKSLIALNMARNMAINFQEPVAIFSLEMSSAQLTDRLISSETGISSDRLRTGDLDSRAWEELNSKTDNLSRAPIYIDDTPGLSILELKAKARRLVSQKQVKMIIIDYLQLMTAPSNTKQSREQEISSISRALKGLAKELNMPVIALAQLSRAVEQRSDKRPMLSDLRESGGIEADADVVSFIYRPEYYGQTSDEAGNDITGLTEFIIAKHRNGSTETARLRFEGALARFEDYDLQAYNPNLTPINNSDFLDIDNDGAPF